MLRGRNIKRLEIVCKTKGRNKMAVHIEHMKFSRHFGIKMVGLQKSLKHAWKNTKVKFTVLIILFEDLFRR